MVLVVRKLQVEPHLPIRFADIRYRERQELVNRGEPAQLTLEVQPIVPAVVEEELVILAVAVVEVMTAVSVSEVLAVEAVVLYAVPVLV